MTMELTIGDLVRVREGARVWTGSPMDDASIAIERAWSGAAYGIVMGTTDCPKGMALLRVLGVVGYVELNNVAPAGA